MSPAELKKVEDRIEQNKERLNDLERAFPYPKARLRHVNRKISELKKEISQDEVFLSLLRKHA